MKAVTVKGLIDETELGQTLVHEHLNVDSRFLCTDRDAVDVPIRNINVEDILRHPMRFLDNLNLQDEDTARLELNHFSAVGGRTIVDVTPHMGTSRNPDLLRRLSEATNVNIIMGSGWYVFAAHPDHLLSRSDSEITDMIVRDLIIGDPESGIRAGIIGEIGTGDPLLPREEVILRAAARAHVITGCPMNIHMAAGCREVFHILDILESEGVDDLSRVVISHMDVQIDLGQQREVISRGARVEYDTFGHMAYPDSRGFMMPTDEERIDAIADLASAGLLNSVVVSHDVCLKHLWKTYGGSGYTPLLTDLRPLFHSRGFTNTDIDTLLIENPQSLLAYHR